MRVKCQVALFTNSPEDWQRLDWQILRDGGISLYRQQNFLAEDMRWFAAQNYDIHEFHCEHWDSPDALFLNFEQVLSFSQCRNFDALEDDLTDLPIRGDGGAVLVLHRFDVYAAGSGARLLPSGCAENAVLLDVLARVCRFFLLNSRRFVTLVQTDNRDLRVGPLAAVSPSWNHREWLDKTQARERPNAAARDLSKPEIWNGLSVPRHAVIYAGAACDLRRLETGAEVPQVCRNQQTWVLKLET